MKKIKFGFCVPVYANPGLAFCRTPAYKKLDWDSIRKTVLYCEELGYDSIFIADHVFWGRDGAIWEGMSLMAALAAITRKLQIIPIHLCNNFRHPGLVAKAFATMSHISDGRVELFYDYGWRKKEFDAYGFDFCGSAEERIAQMIEGIEVIKGLLEEDEFSFTGKFYKLKNAICNPKPIKKIPIWLGETNNSKMTSAIVQYADVFNSMPCSLEAFQNKLDMIKLECEQQGRDFAQFGFSLETQILIRENESELDKVFSDYKELEKYNNSRDEDVLAQFKATNPTKAGYYSRQDLEKQYLIGTPRKIKEQLDAFIAKGVSHFMLWFMDYPDDTGIKLFAEKIFPRYINERAH